MPGATGWAAGSVSRGCGTAGNKEGVKVFARRCRGGLPAASERSVAEVGMTASQSSAHDIRFLFAVSRTIFAFNSPRTIRRVTGAKLYRKCEEGQNCSA